MNKQIEDYEDEAYHYEDEVQPSKNQVILAATILSIMVISLVIGIICTLL